MFPKLQALMDIHVDSLYKLQAQQEANMAVVLTIADVLVSQFDVENSHSLRHAYGEFYLHLLCRTTRC